MEIMLNIIRISIVLWLPVNIVMGAGYLWPEEYTPRPLPVLAERTTYCTEEDRERARDLLRKGDILYAKADQMKRNGQDSTETRRTAILYTYLAAYYGEPEARGAMQAYCKYYPEYREKFGLQLEWDEVPPKNCTGS